MDILAIISLVAGVISIILAIVAMAIASASERRSQENFEKTQKMMQEIYDKTKDALAQIDKKTEVIESVVQRNQEHLMTTMTNLLNETIIPKKTDVGEEMGIQFITTLLQNPSGAEDKMKVLQQLAKIVDNFPTNK